MKNAFDVNLPKPQNKLKSPVSTLASPGPIRGPESSEVEPRPKVKARRRIEPQGAPVLPLPGDARRTRRMEPARVQSHRAYLAVVEQLEAQLHRAVEERGEQRRNVERAREVLARTTDAASDALAQLATIERQLEERRAVLTSLLSEIDGLQENRLDTLELARRLSRIHKR